MDQDLTDYPVDLHYYSILSGEKLPGWRRIVARHQNATTPMSATAKHCSGKSSGYFYLAYRTRTPPNPWQWTEHLVEGVLSYTNGYVFPSSGAFDISSANNLAKARFIKNAKKAQSSFTGGVFIGEFLETFRMMRHPLTALHKGLGDYLGDVKKRVLSQSKRRMFGFGTKRQKVDRLNRIVNGTWLEHRYGWGPLMDDVRSGAETVARIRMNMERSLVPVTGYGEYTTSSNGDSGFDSYSLRTVYKTDYIGKVIYRGAVKVLVADPEHKYLANVERVGLMPHDFIPTIYELIPYSFLIDYVTNLNDVVNACCFGSSNFAWISQSTVRQAIKTVYTEFDLARYTAAFGPSANRQIMSSSFSPSRLSLLDKSVGRADYVGSLVPDLSFDIRKLSPVRSLNVAALALSSKRLSRWILKDIL